jgi:hypothetical protein
MRFSDPITDGWSADQELIPLRERVKTFEGILKTGIAPFKDPPLRETHKLLAAFGSAMTTLRATAADIVAFKRRAYDIDTRFPILPAAGLEIGRLPFEEAQRELLLRYDAAVRDIARLLECDRVGRVTWADHDKVRFDYIEAIDEMGVLTWRRHRVKHTHELVKAVSHPLDEPGVPMDRRTRELVALLPEAWRPYARIITGLEILKEQAHAGTDEHRTGLGRALSHVDPQALGIAAAGASLLGLGLAALSWLGTALSVAIADPCLALGEYCLHGWED